jgi:hypothetical protein
MVLGSTPWLVMVTIGCVGPESVVWISLGVVGLSEHPASNTNPAANYPLLRIATSRIFPYQEGAGNGPPRL